MSERTDKQADFLKEKRKEINQLLFPNSPEASPQLGPIMHLELPV